MDILSEINHIRRARGEVESEPLREALDHIAKALNEIQRTVDRFDQEKTETRP